MVIWSMIYVRTAKRRKIGQGTHTLKYLPCRARLDSHLVDIGIAKSTMRRMSALKAASTGPEIVGATETLAIQAGEELGG
jgi:hypothetical protein